MAEFDWSRDTGRIGPGRNDIEFSITLNGAADPTAVQGVGGTGSQTIPNFLIKTATYSATGKIAFVLQDRWTANRVLFAAAELEDAASPDGAYATVGNFANEGTSNALTFTVATYSAGGVATAYSARRLFVSIVIRNTAATMGP